MIRDMRISTAISCGKDIRTFSRTYKVTTQTDVSMTLVSP